MHFAAKMGKVDAIEALKEAGCDVSTKRNDGKRPVQLATENGHVTAARILKDLRGPGSRWSMFRSRQCSELHVGQTDPTVCRQTVVLQTLLDPTCRT